MVISCEVFPEVWIFGNIRKALYFMHFWKRYESLSLRQFIPRRWAMLARLREYRTRGFRGKFG